MDPALSEPPIAGVTLTDLREIPDSRGAVLHMFRADAADFVRFGECYFSEVLPGAVKAWKRHRHQTQNLAVPAGRIRLVIFDDRPASPTRGRLLSTELGRPDAYRRVGIPPGVWYGFAGISAGAALVANCPDRPHDPTDSETCASSDAAIPYSWESAPLPAKS